MAKVGRAARVASRQRVETISGDKTIASAETGELYIQTANAEITLPAVQDGAYFKFVVGADLANNAKVLEITAGSAILKGGVTVQKAGAAVVYSGNATARTKITVDANGNAANKMLAGSTIECYCDGSGWFISGLIMVAGTVTVALS